MVLHHIFSVTQYIVTNANRVVVGPLPLRSTMALAIISYTISLKQNPQQVIL